METSTLQLTGYPNPAHTYPYILSSDKSNAPPAQYQAVRLTYLMESSSRNLYVGNLSMGNRPPFEAAVKLVIGKDKVQSLRHEANLYNEDLKRLQGVVVPRYYGFYTATIEVCGVPQEIGCLLLELCKPGPVLEGREQDRYNVSRVEAIRRLHVEAGVCHGSIAMKYHHFIRQDSSARIVDFSLAGRAHKCAWGRPCDELKIMQINLLGPYYAK